MTLVQEAPVAPMTRAERSLAPDIARGGMLLFIALANVAFYQWGRGLDQYGHVVDSTGADRGALFVEQLLIAERSRPMFAILYGFGLAVMASRMTASALDAEAVRAVLRRRSWWLVALGVLHATLLFGGDILAPYGATGLIALGFVHLPNSALRRWFWGTAVYVALVSTSLIALLFSGVWPIGGSSDAGAVPGQGYLESVLVGGAFSAASLVIAVLLLQYIPLVIGGMMLQRAGWLQRPGENLVTLRRVFLSAMVVNVASSLPAALIGLGAWHPGPVGMFSASYATLLGGLYAGLGYICGFALLAHRWSARGRRGLPGAIAALGERSLTGYLGQSIIMAPLLTAWGLGLGDGLGYLGAFGLAIGAWATTLVVAVVMDRRGMRGPFEVLLRRLVYGRAARRPAEPGAP